MQWHNIYKNCPVVGKPENKKPLGKDCGLDGRVILRLKLST
jgi:hypothetical protein